jgi:hypothetical protein
VDRGRKVGDDAESLRVAILPGIVVPAVEVRLSVLGVHYCHDLSPDL